MSEHYAAGCKSARRYMLDNPTALNFGAVSARSWAGKGSRGAHKPLRAFYLGFARTVRQHGARMTANGSRYGI